MTIPKFDAALVDGENLSRVQVMMLKNALVETPIKLFFGSSSHIEWKWYADMEFVPVPSIGKESVDRAVAMQCVHLYLKDNVRNFLLISHDMDYGSTAIHLKHLYPDINVTIAASSHRISQEYKNQLSDAGVSYFNLFDLEKINLVAKLFSIHNQFAHKGFVTINEMADFLINEGMYFKRDFHSKIRQLNKDMKEIGFVISENPMLYHNGMPVLTAPPLPQPSSEDWYKP